MPEPIQEPYSGWATERRTTATPEGTPWADQLMWPQFDTVDAWLKEQGGLKRSPENAMARASVTAQMQKVVAFQSWDQRHQAAIAAAHQASYTWTPEEREKVWAAVVAGGPFSLLDPYFDHAAFEERMKALHEEFPDVG